MLSDVHLVERARRHDPRGARRRPSGRCARRSTRSRRCSSASRTRTSATARATSRWSASACCATWSGVGESASAEDAPKGSIAVAHELSPADAAQLGRAEAAGFCTEGGGRTSHTAIVARALGLPYVVGVEGLGHKVWSGMTVVIDGLRGEVILDPDAEALRRYEARADVAPRAGAAAGGDPRRRRSQTTDGTRRPPARQRRDAGGDPDRRRAGRRVGGPVPHRVPLPRAHRAAVGGRAVRARRGGAARAWAAGRSPSARSISAATSCRRRCASRAGTNPAMGLRSIRYSLQPHRRLPHPAARALPRRRRGADADPVPADLGRRRAARRQAALRRGRATSWRARGSPTSPRSRSAS